MTHAFAAPILRHVHPGTMTQHIIPIPDDVAEALLSSGTRRVVVRLNDLDIKRALHKAGGQTVLVVSRRLLRDLKASEGDFVTVDIMSDPNPDHVDVPEELAAALAQDDEARARFEAMTPGKQRSLTHHVNSAKRSETRLKRAHELAYKLRTYTLNGD
ncbi:MAG: YdeI/OmpD-associated family protein [Bacteroidota bacterium]